MTSHPSIYNFKILIRQAEYNSVAFHIRRTDKLKHESPLFPATDYVQKLLEVLEEESIPAETVEVCYLATDDPSVHFEMADALQDGGLSCRLVFTGENDNHGSTKERYSVEAGLEFMAEFSVMLETTFFIGTFNSNVGTLAAALRGCPGFHDPTKHYARSYGVDQDRWYIR